ncbi:hypothetical protein AcV5_009112 [Taiwanofungus camphoratus]|nr:hypothetical protein AcV5_009112 [Antrodia cinnamomea]KAI0940759.1 hypothetical protein AcV7_003053 [Antrodia cinnamomea]
MAPAYSPHFDPKMRAGSRKWTNARWRPVPRPLEGTRRMIVITRPSRRRRRVEMETPYTALPALLLTRLHHDCGVAAGLPYGIGFPAFVRTPFLRLLTLRECSSAAPSLPR